MFLVQLWLIHNLIYTRTKSHPPSIARTPVLYISTEEQNEIFLEYTNIMSK